MKDKYRNSKTCDRKGRVLPSVWHIRGKEEVARSRRKDATEALNRSTTRRAELASRARPACSTGAVIKHGRRSPLSQCSAARFAQAQAAWPWGKGEIEKNKNGQLPKQHAAWEDQKNAKERLMKETHGRATRRPSVPRPCTRRRTATCPPSTFRAPPPSTVPRPPLLRLRLHLLLAPVASPSRSLAPSCDQSQTRAPPYRRRWSVAATATTTRREREREREATKPDIASA